MKCTCSVWAAGLCCVSLLSAACPPMHENSCLWQPLLPLTRMSNSQQGQFVCLCAGSQRRRWPGTFLQGIEHLALCFSLFCLREVNAREKWGYTQGAMESQAEPCVALPYICNNPLLFLSTFLWMAFHRSCQISHMNNTLNSHSAGEKNKNAINAATDDILRGFEMKCIPVLNRNASNSEQQSNVFFIKDKTTKYKYFMFWLVFFIKPPWNV